MMNERASALADPTLAQTGLEPVMQVTCRDRNRLGLVSDLLGGWALGARSVLCLTGDPSAGGQTTVNGLAVCGYAANFLVFGRS